MLKCKCNLLHDVCRALINEVAQLLQKPPGGFELLFGAAKRKRHAAALQMQLQDFVEQLNVSCLTALDAWVCNATALGGCDTNSVTKMPAGGHIWIESGAAAASS